MPGFPAIPATPMGNQGCEHKPALDLVAHAVLSPYPGHSRSLCHRAEVGPMAGDLGQSIFSYGFPVGIEIKVKEKVWELLWEGRAQPSADSGSSAPFAVSPPVQSGEAVTIPSGAMQTQSNSRALEAAVGWERTHPLTALSHPGLAPVLFALRWARIARNWLHQGYTGDQKAKRPAC